MRASPDCDLAGRQPLLPGLATAFDSEAIAHLACLQGVTLPPDAEPAYVRFKPSTSCLVAYRMAGTLAPPSFYVTAFQNGSNKLLKALQRDAFHTSLGSGRIVLTEQAIQVCVFPNDDHMPVLARFTDVGKRKKILRAMCSRETVVSETPLTVLAYKPERRCVLKVTSHDGANMVIRAYEKRSFEPAMASAIHFNEHGGGETQKLLGSDLRHRLLAMEWREGSSLADELMAGRAALSDMESAGASLAAFHAREPGPLPQWNVPNAKRRARQMADSIEVLCPDLATHARRLVRRLSQAVETLEPANATIHHDFNARQVLVHNGTSTIIDLDEASAGPPAIDLGSFIANLRVSVATGAIEELRASGAIDALLHGYKSRASLPSWNDLRVSTALALFAVADQPFRQHDDAWPQGIASMLDMVAAHLEPLA